MSLRTILLKGMLWSLAFAAVTGVLAVLVEGGHLAWRVVGTGFVTALACGLMLPISSSIDREKTRSAGLLGMAVVILEFLMALKRLAFFWVGTGKNRLPLRWCFWAWAPS